MPLFMDFHKIENITVDDVLKAHMADISIQEKYGVKYHQFWVNQEVGTVFCLTEGPDAKTCELVHQMAHGNVACAITEVEPGNYQLLMGRNQKVDHGLVKHENGTIDIGYRSILIISIRAITQAGSSKDLGLLQIPHWAKHLAIHLVKSNNGREVNWDLDDCIVGVFNDASDAVHCSIELKKQLSHHSATPDVILKMGIGSGQPVTEDGEFFTATINLAHRLCTSAFDNQILAASLVKHLCGNFKDHEHAVRFLDEQEERFISSVIQITYQNAANKNFNIENICKQVGISRPQLYRKLTALTGRAPSDFLRDVRLEMALGLLKRKYGNIAQVAFEVGYNNPSYFAKCFADKFGCTPSAIVA